MAYGFNPPGIWGAQGWPFSQGVIAGEGVTLHITGQVGWDAEGRLVGPGDAATQAVQAFENIRVILEAAGGALEDIVALTIYFLDRGDLPAIREVRQRYLPMPGAPASTAVQVAGLVEPDLLVEFTPVALIPHKRFKQPKR